MAENYYSNKKKDDHIEINLTKDVGSKTTTRLDEYHFIHNALPEADLNQIDPSCVIFNRRLSFPILISSMTGGTVKGAAINESFKNLGSQWVLDPNVLV